MITSRGLFGFACGGVVAAPAMLVGEKTGESIVPLVHGIAPLEPQLAVTVNFDDAAVRRMVDEGIRQAIEAHERGGRHRSWETRRG